MSYGIYSITNKITGDKYIGQTKRDFNERWSRHIWELRNSKHDNKYLQRSWCKYGEEAFEFIAVHICDELDILNDLEKYYIKKYDTFNNGFNLTTGGEAFDYELDEKSRLKMIEGIKKSNRLRSNYTETQIARVKELLVDRDFIGKLSKIAKMTGVNESVISSVRTLSSWVDVREDLNEKIIELNDLERRNKMIFVDFTFNKLTLDELSIEYNLSRCSISNILKESGLKNNLAKINKENTDLKLEVKLVELYYKQGITNYFDISKAIGISPPTAKRLLDKNNIVLNYKKKKTDEKHINWDEKSKRYLIRMSKGFDKQIVIGSTKNLDEAIKIRDESIGYIENKEYDKLNNFIKSMKSDVIPKKIITVINKETGEKQTIEGIGVASRKLNIPRKSIEKVLSGKQKSSKGYIFEYSI